MKSCTALLKDFEHSVGLQRFPERQCSNIADVVAPHPDKHLISDRLSPMQADDVRRQPKAYSSRFRAVLFFSPSASPTAPMSPIWLLFKLQKKYLRAPLRCCTSITGDIDMVYMHVAPGGARHEYVLEVL